MNTQYIPSTVRSVTPKKLLDEQVGPWFRQQNFVQISWLDYYDKALKAFQYNGYPPTSYVPFLGVERTIGKEASSFEPHPVPHDVLLGLYTNAQNNVPFEAYRSPISFEYPITLTLEEEKAPSSEEVTKLAHALVDMTLSVIPHAARTGWSDKDLDTMKTVTQAAYEKNKADTTKGTPSTVPTALYYNIPQARSTLRDIEAFFEKSGHIRAADLPHTPYQAFLPKGDAMTIQLVFTTAELVKLPPGTLVMTQWTGKNRSDFFVFTVGQVQEYVRKNNIRLG